MNPAKLILFDIDNTLIKSGYPAARRRFSVALKKRLKKEIKIDWEIFDGATDIVILRHILEKEGYTKKEISKKLQELFEEAYSYFAQNLKSDYKKRLIKPGVSLVKKLYRKKDYYLAVLTGNEENVGRLKIGLAGLSYYFRFGLFGHEAENRNELAKLVFARAKKFLKIDFKPEDIYIIGDTRYDIKCGKAIKVNTIAVATGYSNLSELKKAKPDLAVKSLADKSVINFILKGTK